MAVYFYYRCPYEGPAGGRLRRFEDDTVLDWFRNRWHSLGDTDDKVVFERVTREMGCEVYSFSTLFTEAARGAWQPPTNARELGECVASGVYNNHVLCPSPHVLQVDTDDDEVGLAYYFFDDHYLARHGKRAAFLLRNDWRLPDGDGPGGFRAAETAVRLSPRGRGPGTTYVIDLDHVGDMDELVDGCRIDGVRLPQLMTYLAGCEPDAEEGDPLWLPRALLTVEPRAVAPDEAAFLRGLRQRPDDAALWGVYSDWLQDRGEPPAGLHLLRRALTWAGRWYDSGRKPRVDLGEWTLAELARWAQPQIAAIERIRERARSLVHVGEHVAQLCLHYDQWKTPRRVRDIYHEWIYFDDLWASAHPDLANAILRHVRRWDVLSTSRARLEDD